jgi:hypothetical protein
MIPVSSEVGAVKKRELIVVFIGLTLAASVWYWSGWRKSDSALSFLRLRVNDLRGRVEKERAASAEAVGMLRRF